MASISTHALYTTFRHCFPEVSSEKIALAFAPGRVNLIGEHTDYNGGWVLPAAMQLGIGAAVVYHESPTIVIRSAQFAETFQIDLQQPVFHNYKDWRIYPQAVVRQLLAEGHHLPGASIVLHSDLPTGAGLSSSAAIEVLLGFVLQPLVAWGFPERVSLAKLAQAAENQWVGMPCGIMDMFAISLAQPQQALLLDCHSLAFELVEAVPPPAFSWCVIHTGKPRRLVASKYAERRAECELALDWLQEHGVEATHLSACNLSDLEALAQAEPLLYQRAKHVVTENQRVKALCQAMQMQQWGKVGAYLTQSHLSLRDDYAVTGMELDTLFEISRKIEGCQGLRMNGAGFGGCALALVEQDKLTNFQTHLAISYQLSTGFDPVFMSLEIAGGVDWVLLPHTI